MLTVGDTRRLIRRIARDLDVTIESVRGGVDCGSGVEEDRVEFL